MTLPPKFPPSLSSSFPWGEEEEAIWVSSRLMLRRNLARFSFQSKLSNAGSLQVLEQLKQALCSPLADTQFFADTQLTALHRQLIFEHFMMMYGFQQSPNGAAIGLNDSSTFLTLINFDNHLELYSIAPGNSLEKLWPSLSQAEAHVGKELGFAFHPKFGYLTADPSQCGTGFTASVILHLPALVHSRQIDGALKNIEEADVVCQGLTGDTGNLIGDLLAVENRYTIGMSEEAILHAVQSAATKLASAELVIRDHLRQECHSHIKDLISKGFGLLMHSHQLEIKEALELLSLMKLGLAIRLIEGVDTSVLSALFFKARKGHLTRLFPDLKEPDEIEQKRADLLQKELENMRFND